MRTRKIQPGETLTPTFAHTFAGPVLGSQRVAARTLPLFYYGCFAGFWSRGILWSVGPFLMRRLIHHTRYLAFRFVLRFIDTFSCPEAAGRIEGQFCLNKMLRESFGFVADSWNFQPNVPALTLSKAFRIGGGFYERQCLPLRWRLMLCYCPNLTVDRTGSSP